MCGDLQAQFRRELSTTARAFRASLVEAMSTLGVHPGQNFLIDELNAEQPLSTSELARRLGIEVPTAVRMVQRMAAAGVVRRVQDPRDGRRVLVSLTDQGEEIARALPSRLDAVSSRALDGLDPSERATLMDLLARVRMNLDSPPYQRYRESH